MTPAEFSKLLTEVETGADLALPLLGHAEFIPIVEAAVSLIRKISVAAQNAAGDASIAAAMQAARVAADTADLIKFGK